MTDFEQTRAKILCKCFNTCFVMLLKVYHIEVSKCLSYVWKFQKIYKPIIQGDPFKVLQVNSFETVIIQKYILDKSCLDGHWMT